MKRILFIHSSLKMGGAERMLVYIANLLAGEYQVVILLFDQTELFYDVDKGIEVITLNNLYLTSQNAKSKLDRLKSTNAMIKALMEKEREIHPDMTIVFDDRLTWITWMASSIGKSGTLRVYSQRNDPYDKSKLKNHLFSLIYRNAGGVVFQLEEVKAFYNCEGDRFEVIPNPITINPVKYTGIRNKYVLAAGRFQNRKRFDVLIEAFYYLNKEYPTYELLLFGEGEEREKLQGLINKYGLNKVVKMPGIEKDVIQNHSDAGIFVLSSDSEGMPNTLIEAMAQGIPCIATDCTPGGARFLLDEGKNGILVPRGDAQKLYLAMKEYIENPNELVHKVENALTFLQRLLPSEINQKWTSYIRRIMEGN